MPLSLTLALAAAMLPPAPAQPRQRPVQARSEWRAWVSVCRTGKDPADPALPRMQAPAESDCFDTELSGLVTEADIPVALRRRRFAGTSRAVLDIAPEGTVAGCRIESSSGDARLDRVACDMLSRRARFRPIYAGPGRPVAAHHRITVGWTTTDDPPLPVFSPVPPPPAQALHADWTRQRVWPRLRWHSPVEFPAAPRIQDSYPAGAANSGGMVSLDLLASAERGIEECSIGLSSGDAALDEAACRIARTLELRYRQPCDVCARQIVPLQVVWRRQGGSHVRYPLPFLARPEFGAPPPRDPADTRTAVAQRPFPAPVDFALTLADFRGIEPRGLRTGRFVAEVAVDARGRPTACRTNRSTGDERIDARACALIIRRARYLPRTDVFGDPVAEPGFGHVVNLTFLE